MLEVGPFHFVGLAMRRMAYSAGCAAGRSISCAGAGVRCCLDVEAEVAVGVVEGNILNNLA